MKKQNNQIYLLKEEKVSKALLKLGIPSMIGMMISALYNIVDAYFVGKLGTSEIAAVSVVYPLSIVILGCSLLFGCGAGSYVSRLLGDKKYKEASICASTALVTSCIIGIIIISVMLIFINPMLRVLGATNTTFVFAKEYAEVFILGLVFNVFNATLNNIITAEGASVFGMKAMLYGGIINMILDPILITTLNFGVRGAAYATLISRLVSFSVYLLYILRGKGVLKFAFINFKPSKRMYNEILKVGIPMLVYQVLTSIALSLINSLSSIYGDSAVAALSIVSRIMSLTCMAVFGFLKGYQPFVGYNYGANKMNRVKKSTKLSLIWTTSFCMIVSILCIVFCRQIIMMFSKNDIEVISIGCKSLIFNSIMFIFFGYQAVYSQMYLSFGRAKEGGLISLGRQGIFFIPIIFILSNTLGLNGILYTQPLADCFSLFLVIFLNCRFKNIHSSNALKVVNNNLN